MITQAFHFGTHLVCPTCRQTIDHMPKILNYSHLVSFSNVGNIFNFMIKLIVLITKRVICVTCKPHSA